MENYNTQLEELKSKLDDVNKKEADATFQTELPKVNEGEPKAHNRVKKRKLLDRIKEKLFPDRSFMINMELRNGMQRTFLISTKNDHFKFMGGTYIIDHKLKYYNIDDKNYCLDYHQNFTLPIKKEFNVGLIKEAMQSSNITEVENATNPQVLDDFIERKVIEQVMRGQDFEEVLKSIKIGILVAAVASTLHLVIFAFKSGMLSGGSIGI